MIGVIAYGVGNIGSMINMLKRIGVPAFAASQPSELLAASKLILPGVGAFDHGMFHLARGGWIEPLRDMVDRGVPLLGVCLGMQLLGDGSEEGTSAGLGFVSGQCRRLQQPVGTDLKIPHMGWKTLDQECPSALLNGLEPHARYYFVHSYHFVCAEPRNALASAHYGTQFTAVVNRDNVWGTQFHPEKSHRYGMALLQNFANL